MTVDFINKKLLLLVDIDNGDDDQYMINDITQNSTAIENTEDEDLSEDEYEDEGFYYF